MFLEKRLIDFVITKSIFLALQSVMSRISWGRLEALVPVGEQSALVNGKEVKLDSPAFVENDRTYTPIRFISEQLGADVEWIAEKLQVVITK